MTVPSTSSIRFTPTLKIPPAYMAISVHPYIMGAPHRTKYFRRVFETIRKKPDVLFWTGEQILDWYLGNGPKPP